MFTLIALSKNLSEKCQSLIKKGGEWAFDLKIYIITIYVRKQNYFNIEIYFKIIKYNMTLKYFHIQSNSWILQYSPKKL